MAAQVVGAVAVSESRIQMTYVRRVHAVAEMNHIGEQGGSAFASDQPIRRAASSHRNRSRRKRMSSTRVAGRPGV